MAWIGSDIDTPAVPGESTIHTLNFDRNLADSENIIAVVGGQWTIGVAADSPNDDPNAALLADGIATFGGTECFQRITWPSDNPVDVKYVLGAIAITDRGNRVPLHMHRWCRAIT